MNVTQAKTKAAAKLYRQFFAQTAETHGLTTKQAKAMVEEATPKDRRRAAFLAGLCMSLKEEGWSLGAIAHHLGCFPSAVSHWLRQSPLPCTEGSKDALAVVKDMEPEERVKSLATAGWSMSAIARGLGVSRSTVRYYLRASS